MKTKAGNRVKDVHSRLQTEWTNLVVWLGALAAIDSAIFALTLESADMVVSQAARTMVIASGICAVFGILLVTWFIWKFCWTSGIALGDFDEFMVLRGAAPSFGITTSIEVETFPVPTYSVIFSYTWDLGAQTASQALIDFQNFITNTTDLPHKFGGGLTFSKGTNQGDLVFILIGGWYGPQGKLDEVLTQFLGKMPKPATNDRLGNRTYIDSVRELSGGLDTSNVADERDTFYARSLMTPVGDL
ncbi:hypothetical protein PM082_000561 [Marasmius tenuissimus]|nr:hypothetical protein PM082_000561 [Marasmius tenuissimus]